jgi:hypothetical protein
VGVPSGSSGSSLTLTITNDSNSDHVGFVHDTTVRDSKTVTKFTTFVNSSGSLMSEIVDKGMLTSALTWDGNPPGILKACTNASIPSADMEYSG